MAVLGKLTETTDRPRVADSDFVGRREFVQSVDFIETNGLGTSIDGNSIGVAKTLGTENWVATTNVQIAGDRGPFRQINAPQANTFGTFAV